MSGKSAKQDRFEVVISEKNPELLIVTPLRKRDEIFNECKTSIIRGQPEVKKVWVSFRSNANASINRIEGYKKSKTFLRKNLPSYILFCDNDVLWMPGTFRKMINVLKESAENIGYVYCGFRYEGHRNIRFSSRPFDANLLRSRNYISTMSIQRTSVFKKHGRLDPNLRRFQDWDMWLNYLINHNIIGVPSNIEGFIAVSSERDISMQPDRAWRNLKTIIKKYRLAIQINGEK